MRVVAVADLHGQLPQIPECDLLVIAGDICIDRDASPRKIFGKWMYEKVGSADAIRSQAKWLAGPFKEWLDAVPAKHVVACWGNHDYIGQRRPDLVPKLRWHMLTDESVEIDGMKIYGSPYQPWFYDWAFNAPSGLEGELFLAEKFAKIPDDTDIIIVHGPPRGYGDVAPDGEPTGPDCLTERIFAVKPKLSVHGHIHCGRGMWEFDRGNMPLGIICNASILNEAYEMVHEPMVIDVR